MTSTITTTNTSTTINTITLVESCVMSWSSFTHVYSVLTSCHPLQNYVVKSF
jgi:hypothetical protein